MILILKIQKEWLALFQVDSGKSCNSQVFIFGAKVLILDEPTSALGVRESNKVVDQITKLKSQDINVILISHNIEQAFMLADRFLFLKVEL